MKIVTGKEMAQIDHITQTEYSISGLILMENAGIAITEKILDIYCDIFKNKDSNCIAIIVGNGNNGGDGLVVARQLLKHGIKSRIFLCQSEDKLKEQAKINFEICKKLNIEYYEINTDENLEKHWNLISNHKLLLDSIFGTGLNRNVEGHYKKIIDKINDYYNGKTIALDVPSGLICEIGYESLTAIKADSTITVALPKMNMIDFPGRNFVGNLHIVQIGFPEELLKNDSIKFNYINDDLIELPSRESNTHKGSYGHLLIIAGSEKYGGAAILSSSSAVRTGCGLITLLSINDVCNKIHSRYPQVITYPAKTSTFGTIESSIFDEIRTQLEDFSCILIGPGLGNNKESKKLLEKLLKSSYEGNLIIDADAINIISSNKELIDNLTEKTLITPHIGEMSRLIDNSIDDIKKNKIEAIGKFLELSKTNIILKDAVSLIYLNDNTYYFNDHGNNSLAQGGSGDVLAGLIAGFASYSKIKDSVLLSSYMHGKAAEISSMKNTNYAMSLNDLIDDIPFVLKDLVCRKK